MSNIPLATTQKLIAISFEENIYYILVILVYNIVSFHRAGWHINIYVITI